jgi:hypothetical protein
MSTFKQQIQEKTLTNILSKLGFKCIYVCQSSALAPCWVKHEDGNYLEQDLSKCKLLEGLTQ